MDLIVNCQVPQQAGNELAKRLTVSQEDLCSIELGGTEK